MQCLLIDYLLELIRWSQKTRYPENLFWTHWDPKLGMRDVRGVWRCCASIEMTLMPTFAECTAAYGGLSHNSVRLGEGQIGRGQKLITIPRKTGALRTAEGSAPAKLSFLPQLCCWRPGSPQRKKQGPGSRRQPGLHPGKGEEIGKGIWSCGSRTSCGHLPSQVGCSP